MLSEPQWVAFAGVTAAVLGLLVALARASSAMMDAEADAEPVDAAAAEAEPLEPGVAPGDGRGVEPDESLDSISTVALLGNVALTQGVLGAVLLFGAWYARIPASAFGVEPTPASAGVPALAVGVGLGVALYVGDELAARLADAFGVSYSEQLRELLAPNSVGGWAVLLLVVLPVIAGFEEFLFRAALVGAMSAGFGLPPWALAAVSSVVFAVGHETQGSGGVVVTGALGFVLAAAFVVTGSLLVVVVAHYLVNALEFVVHEGLGVEWAS